MEGKLKDARQLLTAANLQNIRTAGVHSIPRNDEKAKYLRLYTLKIQQERLEKLYYIWDMRRVTTEKQWLNVSNLIKKTEKDLLLKFQKEAAHPLVGFA